MHRIKRNTYLSKAIAVILLAALVATALVNMASPPDNVVTHTGLPRFRDVPAGFWAYADIEYASDRGIVNGIGDGKFGPNQAVSPGQFATMLVRTFFPDDVSAVDENSVMETWYGAYMAVAKDRYLLGNTTVNSVYSKTNGRDFWTLSIVDGPMNRYDLAQMLYNLTKKLGAMELPSNPTIGAEALIPDFEDVPARNRVAVAACFRMGLLSGVDGKGTFAGYQTVTRAQAAAVLSRFLRESGFEEPKGSVATHVSESTLPQSERKTGKDPAGNTCSWNVNRLRDVGKSDNYPTQGSATSPNANGYYTSANVSLGNAQLVYELLDLVNESRAEAGASPLEWVNGPESDAAEEYTLLRAHEITSLYSHTRPCGESLTCASEIIVIGRADAREAHRAWVLSSGHKKAMTGSDYQYMCAARCGDAWIVTLWCDFDFSNMVRFEKISHNYHFNCSKGAYGPQP